MEKNVNAHDMELMLGKASERQREGNAKTAFLIENRNRWIEFERLQRVSKRRNLDLEDWPTPSYGKFSPVSCSLILIPCQIHLFISPMRPPGQVTRN
jgi:hypothetical protein